jgi:2-oxoglutarate ferredoxin oxidoreductase subunit delta
MKNFERNFCTVKPQVVKGEIHIINERCKGCGFCIDYCPNKVLEFSEEFNEKGYHPPEVVNPDKCVCCGFCEEICPDFAIFVTQSNKFTSIDKEQLIVHGK